MLNRSQSLSFSVEREATLRERGCRGGDEQGPVGFRKLALRSPPVRGRQGSTSLPKQLPNPHRRLRVGQAVHQALDFFQGWAVESRCLLTPSDTCSAGKREQRSEENRAEAAGNGAYGHERG